MIVLGGLWVRIGRIEDETKWVDFLVFIFFLNY